MKKFLKLAVVAAVTTAGSLATAPKAEARVFPYDYASPCYGGVSTVYHYGWFGSYQSLEVVDC